ncbi:MAG TPA: (2Fe-2S)-binding protein [Acidimicrobiales bacterium]
MIVCHCEVVNDRAIKAEVARGAATEDEIGERCGAGTHCGSCRPTICALLAALTAGEQEQPAA